MSVTQLCPDDLLLAARHGALAGPEEARLTFHLARCARCQAALDAGRAFDGVLGARTGDEAIAARIAAQVSPRPVRRWLACALGGGLLLCGSVAVAAVGTRVWQRVFPNQQVHQTSDRTGAAAGESGRSTVPTAVPQAAVVPDATAASSDKASEASERDALAPGARAAGPRHVSDRSSSARSLGGERQVASATALFAEANALRGKGNLTEARKRYLELQSGFAGSTEAKVSLVSLGRIELGAEPTRALSHFDAYLAQSVHTTLTEEALFGRASALARLGRTELERATWRKLVERFPSSVYAERARARLAAAP